MSSDAIFGPFFAMMALTIAVWIFMYFRRIGYMLKHRIHPQRLSTPEGAAELIPEPASWPANNLKNLFELPVLFYALCMYLFVSESVDSSFVVGAWAYVVLRAIHSFIQCVVNRVKLRFTVYLLSSIVLWIMVACAALDWLQG